MVLNHKWHGIIDCMMNRATKSYLFFLCTIYITCLRHIYVAHIVCSLLYCADLIHGTKMCGRLPGGGFVSTLLFGPTVVLLGLREYVVHADEVRGGGPAVEEVHWQHRLCGDDPGAIHVC